MTKSLSRSDQQAQRHRQRYTERMPSPGDISEQTTKILKFYKKMEIEEDLRELDPEWQKDNMEYDLRSTDWILEKVRESKIYAQHLYAAMCNNEFQKLDVIPILTDKRWSSSWRHAGGIIAHMRKEGDYMDWYCSGIYGDYTTPTKEEWDKLNFDEQAIHKEIQASVSEAVVTDEIRADLKRLGWTVILDE